MVDPQASTASMLLCALGGPSNLRDLESCVLRIRVEVYEPALVDEEALRIPGVLAVVRSGNIVQIVAGTRSDAIYEQIITCLDSSGSHGEHEKRKWHRISHSAITTQHPYPQA